MGSMENNLRHLSPIMTDHENKSQKTEVYLRHANLWSKRQNLEDTLDGEGYGEGHVEVTKRFAVVTVCVTFRSFPVKLK